MGLENCITWQRSHGVRHKERHEPLMKLTLLEILSSAFYVSSDSIIAYIDYDSGVVKLYGENQMTAQGLMSLALKELRAGVPGCGGAENLVCTKVFVIPISFLSNAS